MNDLVTRPTWAITAPVVGRDRLDQLLSRIADGDRAAFRRLYAFMARRVWHMATAAPLGPAAAVAVTMSTFVEVWHSAGAARYDARDWIAAVSTGRADDRLRTIKANGPHGGRPAPQHTIADSDDQPPTVDVYDSHIRRELTDLLGGGRATIRTSSGVFVRIEDLGDALVTIAAAAGSPRRPPVPAAPLPSAPPSIQHR